MLGELGVEAQLRQAAVSSTSETAPTRMPPAAPPRDRRVVLPARRTVELLGEHPVHRHRPDPAHPGTKQFAVERVDQANRAAATVGRDAASPRAQRSASTGSSKTCTQEVEADLAADCEQVEHLTLR